MSRHFCSDSSLFYGTWEATKIDFYFVLFDLIKTNPSESNSNFTAFYCENILNMIFLYKNILNQEKKNLIKVIFPQHHNLAYSRLALLL